ncbi:protein kinase [bacterium]
MLGKKIASGASCDVWEVSKLTGKNGQQYQLLEKLGEGAFGTVYQAIALDEKGGQTNNFVAVKIFRRPDYAQADRDYESKIMQTFQDSPYVVNYITEGESDQSEAKGPFIVMEWCNEGDFVDFVRKLYSKPNFNEQIMAYFIQVLQGLKTVHENRLAYVDLKPENIMTHNGQLKFIDMASVRNATKKDEFFPKTAGFQPKKLWEGSQFDLKTLQQSDIYSFGMILLEWLFPLVKDEVSNILRINPAVKSLEYLVNIYSTRQKHEDIFTRDEIVNDLIKVFAAGQQMNFLLSLIIRCFMASKDPNNAASIKSIEEIINDPVFASGEADKSEEKVLNPSNPSAPSLVSASSSFLPTLSLLEGLSLSSSSQDEKADSSPIQYPGPPVPSESAPNSTSSSLATSTEVKIDFRQILGNLYHNLNRQSAEEYLKDKEVGSCIFRPSSREGNIVICKKVRDNEVEHILFRYETGLYVQDDPYLIFTLEKLKLTYKFLTTDGRQLPLPLHKIQTQPETFSYAKKQQERKSELQQVIQSKEDAVTKFNNLLKKEGQYGIEVDDDPRDRYPNIIPYPDTSVVLAENSYINANWADADKRFIATQGPKQETTRDFYQMLKETNAKTVIMLANLFEQEREKCANYWENISHKDLESKTAGLSVRKLMVQESEESKGSQEITQYHFTAWSDHDVPDAKADTAIIEILNKMDEATTESPCVVHCSAGVGRTGSILAIYFTLKELAILDNIDGNTIENKLLETIVDLKSHRYWMVQNEYQFEYCLRFIKTNRNLFKNQQHGNLSLSSETLATSTAQFPGPPAWMQASIGYLPLQIQTPESHYDILLQLEKEGIHEGTIIKENEIEVKIGDRKEGTMKITTKKALSSGAFGAVCEASIQGDDKEYAVKKIKIKDTYELANAIKEINLLREQKDNEFISKIRSTFYIKASADDENADIYIYIVMPKYLELGEVLWKLADKENNNGYAFIWDFVSRLLSGLDSLHDKGIVHRDIKPANFMFTEKGELIYIDLNLAENISNSAIASLKGTPKFCAPELVPSRELAPVDAAKILSKADVWSLGITICTLLEDLGLTNNANLPILIAKDNFMLINGDGIIFDELDNIFPILEKDNNITVNLALLEQKVSAFLESVAWQKIENGMVLKKLLLKMLTVDYEWRSDIKSLLMQKSVLNRYEQGALKPFDAEQKKVSSNNRYAVKASALRMAALDGRKDMVVNFLQSINDEKQRNAIVNMQDGNGYTALHYAASLGKNEIVQMLLDNGADVNIQDSNGYTALHYAASLGKNKIVQILLANGADVTLVNESDKSADDLANSEEIKKMIIKKAMKLPKDAIIEGTGDRDAKEPRKYKILEKVQEGSQGCVYKAAVVNEQGEKTGELVAVKVFYKSSDRDIESKNMQEFNSEHIVKYIDQGIYRTKSRNCPFVVMEWCNGPDLFDYFNNQLSSEANLRIQQLLLVLSQILQGLKFIHEQGFAYIDLKPENMMIHNGIVKFIDMGSVRKEINYGDIFNISAQLQPEITLNAYGYNLEKLQQSDIYSFGMILCECIFTFIQTELLDFLTHKELDSFVHGDVIVRRKIVADKLPYTTMSPMLSLIVRCWMAFKEPEHQDSIKSIDEIINDPVFASVEADKNEEKVVNPSNPSAPSLVSASSSLLPTLSLLGRLSSSSGLKLPKTEIIQFPGPPALALTPEPRVPSSRQTEEVKHLPNHTLNAGDNGKLKPDNKIINGFNGQYKILRKVKEGSTGIVYQAMVLNKKSNEIKEFVAIKQFKRPGELAINDRDDEKNKMQMFNNENIVRYVDEGEYKTENGTYPCLMMEWCNGRNLKDYNNYNTVKLKTLFQILQVLKLIHEQGFAYVDLKPANIMMHNDQVKFIDMGSIRKKTKQGEKFPRTPEWQPQTLFENSEFSLERLQQADIYSFGKILLWCTDADSHRNTWNNIVSLMHRCFRAFEEPENPTSIKSVEQLMRELLMVAIENGETAFVNTQDSYGETVLHWAVRNYKIRMVKFLLKKLPEEEKLVLVNMYDNNGWTALDWAFFNNHKIMIEVLLDAGADPKKSDQEETGLDIAQKENFSNRVHLSGQIDVKTPESVSEVLSFPALSPSSSYPANSPASSIHLSLPLPPIHR